MDDLNRTFSDSNETAGDKIDRTKHQTEDQVDEAQSLINEAKEDARRDWSSAYSDTDEAREELEGDARRKKEDLEGSVDEARVYSGDATAEGQTESAAERLRKRAEASGQHKDDSEKGVVDDLQDKARDLIDRVKGAMDGDKDNSN